MEIIDKRLMLVIEVRFSDVGCLGGSRMAIFPLAAAFLRQEAGGEPRRASW